MRTGERIKQRRRELGLTQADLARKIETKQPTIQSMEQRDGVNSKYLLQLSIALDTSIEWIINGKTHQPLENHTKRDQEFLSLIRALPESEQDQLFKDLVLKKQTYDDLFEELSRKRKG